VGTVVKRCWLWAILFFIIGLYVWFDCVQAESNWFADPNLEIAVREALGLMDCALTEADLLSVVRLDAPARSITNLQGIEYLRNLQYLNLRGNTELESIAPIADLSNLETLVLSDVPVGEQIIYLASLTKLQRLILNNTQITDLTVLGELMANGALQDKRGAGIPAEVDIRNNPIYISSLEQFDGYAPVRPYWNNISKRYPKALPTLLQQNIVINEVMTSNGRTLVDGSGQTSDWIELYNPTDLAIHLGGYYLTDDLDQLDKWPIPAGTWIEPHGYLLIFASGQDQRSGELHTNFKISQTGETIVLTQRDRRTIVDCVYVPRIKQDFSYGRMQDGGALFSLFDRSNATPGKSNNTAVAYIQPDSSLNPQFSHVGGFYTEAFYLNIEPQPGTIVYYTLDGSIPDPERNPERTYVYTEPILIEQSFTPVARAALTIRRGVTPRPPLTHIQSSYNRWYLPRTEQFRGTVIRARAYNANHVPSEVVTQTYFVDPRGWQRHTVPVIAITVDPLDLFDYDNGIYLPGRGFHENLPWAFHIWGSGNFHGRGSLWEREIHIAFWEPGGILAINQNAGVRIHGDASRAYAQKSLRIIASDNYDQLNTFNHVIFPERTNPLTNAPYTEYKSFVLRNGGNTWDNTMFKDGLLHNLLQHTKLDVQNFRPAVVYLNGEYWGIHNLRDRQDEWYFYYKYGIDPEQVEIIEDNVYTNESNTPLDDPEREHYRALLRLIDPDYRTKGYPTVATLADPTVYEQVKRLIDIDQYLDYVSVQIYIQNHDWPGNNVRLWRKAVSVNDLDAPYGHDGLWRWMIYDLDLAFADFTANTIVNATRTNGTEWHNQPWATFLLRSLLQNDEFRIAFLNRSADHMNSTFLPEVVIAEIDRLEAIMEPEIEEHIRRWNKPAATKQMWKQQNNSLRNFARLRPQANCNHLIRYFGLAGTYQLTVQTDSTKGYVKVNSLELTTATPGVFNPDQWTGIYFKDIPITLTAVAQPGSRFAGWEGVPPELRYCETITITPQTDLTITALFI